MKKCYVLFFFIFSSFYTFAQTNNISKLDHFYIGAKFNLNFTQAPKDFSTGIEICSPLLFDRIAINGEISYSFLRGVEKTATVKNEEVFNYFIYKIGILISPGNKEDFLRVYCKTGWIMLETGNDIFSKPFYNGIYGSFGVNISFEKFNFLCFFAEASTHGFFDNPVAEKLTGNQKFGEGIIFSLGLKVLI